MVWFLICGERLLEQQAWHRLLVSKIQELQEFCSGNIGDTGKNIGENIGEFHQFQKYGRNWPFLQELLEIQEVVPGLEQVCLLVIIRYRYNFFNHTDAGVGFSEDPWVYSGTHTPVSYIRAFWFSTFTDYVRFYTTDVLIYHVIWYMIRKLSMQTR